MTNTSNAVIPSTSTKIADTASAVSTKSEAEMSAKPNKANIFSFSLYKEALAQLRLVGIVLGAPLIIFTFISAVYVNFLSTWARGSMQFAGLAEILWLVMLFVWIAPFILGFNLFGFLNKRHKSDFYHSLPEKRLAVFTSFTLAVFTWAFAAFALALVLSTGFIASFGVTRVFDEFLIVLAMFTPALLFAVSVAVFAASVSGTRFTSMIVAALLVALPPLLKSIYAQSVAMSVTALDPQDVFQLGTNVYYSLGDLIFGLDVRLAVWFSQYTGDIIYTLAYALVFFGLAAYFFVTRKSETAGSSASLPWLQWVYRISIAFLPLAIIANMLSWLDGALYLWIIVAAILSLAAVCIFELLSTKKWKNLIYAAPAFGIASVSFVLFLTFVWGVALYEASFQPQGQNIRSVQVLSADYKFSAWLDAEIMPRLNGLQESGVAIQDSSVNRALEEELERVTTIPTWGNFDTLGGNRWGSYMLADSSRNEVVLYAYLRIEPTSGLARNRVLPIGNVTFHWHDENIVNDGNLLEDEISIQLNDLGQALLAQAE